MLNFEPIIKRIEAHIDFLQGELIAMEEDPMREEARYEIAVMLDVQKKKLEALKATL